MSQFFASGGQSIGVSASTSVLPMNTQEWSPLGWTGWISLQSKGLKSLLQHHSSKASILQCSAFFTDQLSHPYMTTGKTIALTRQTFVDKVISLLLNMLSRLVITCLPRSKRFLISWLQSPSAVILEPKKKKKSATVSTVSPSISHEVMVLDAMILIFWMLSFKPLFRPPLSVSSRGSLVPFRPKQNMYREVFRRRFLHRLFSSDENFSFPSTVSYYLNDWLSTLINLSAFFFWIVLFLNEVELIYIIMLVPEYIYILMIQYFIHQEN